MIYLDNNATTRLDPEVRSAMREAEEWFGNPSSVHAGGRRARQAIEENRDEVARLLGALAEEIVFTSGGTEANALAIFGITRDRPGPVVRSNVEHPSVREPFARLADDGRQAISVEVEPSGGLDPARVAGSIPDGTALVSVMMANNEYGGLFPVAEIAAAARDHGAVVHTDAIQAVGKLAVEVGSLGVDLLSCSAHKIHGPKGVGALFIRRGVRLSAHTPGGGQERRLRAGTENTVGIVGFGRAARLARERARFDAVRIEALRDRFERQIRERVPGTRVLGNGSPRLPNTSAVLFEGVSGDALLFRLDLDGVAASAGSACSSGTLAPAASILALGLPPSEARRVLRFSLSRETTSEEIESALRRIEAAVSSARAAAVETGRQQRARTA
jgi:cysteine desulfurase